MGLVGCLICPCLSGGPPTDRGPGRALDSMPSASRSTATGLRCGLPAPGEHRGTRCRRRGPVASARRARRAAPRGSRTGRDASRQLHCPPATSKDRNPNRDPTWIRNLPSTPRFWESLRDRRDPEGRALRHEHSPCPRLIAIRAEDEPRGGPDPHDQRGAAGRRAGTSSRQVVPYAGPGPAESGHTAQGRPPTRRIPKEIHTYGCCREAVDQPTHRREPPLIVTARHGVIVVGDTPHRQPPVGGAIAGVAGAVVGGGENRRGGPRQHRVVHRRRARDHVRGRVPAGSPGHVGPGIRRPVLLPDGPRLP